MLISSLRDTELPTFEDGSIVTIGTFDGVHLGHQQILDQMHDLKKRHPQARTVLLSFLPHPRLILFPEQADLKLLTTNSEKIELLGRYGIDHLIWIPFDKNFALQTAEEFVENVLKKKLNAKALIVGHDHRFGQGREGSFEFLKSNEDKYALEVQQVSRLDLDEVVVSSTQIRQHLFDGNIPAANALLGYPYLLSGKVVKGQQLGRKLGFPTANIQIDDPNKLIPPDGIYATRVNFDNYFFEGLLSIGHKPTLGDNLERCIEVNIFDFNQEIYGESIAVYFKAFIRPQIKFDDVELMRQQMILDKAKAHKILRREGGQ
ncbi:MAG: bifunctional riboflavin kinase/FAD synthetase [Cytophagales bacterium]|nr:MAG: bifunctional riboflavin kinase/FAD synthetase [Cytophagales bacterium]TAF62559.1 MAG: bifunctional riboflavin kinase/FAD synthetase [Cytophagales bacterium]